MGLGGHHGVAPPAPAGLWRKWFPPVLPTVPPLLSNCVPVPSAAIGKAMEMCAPLVPITPLVPSGADARPRDGAQLGHTCPSVPHRPWL